MILAVVLAIWGTFLLLAVWSGKGQGDILQRVSMYLYKKMNVLSIAGKRIKLKNGQLVQSLIALHPGESPDLLLQEYHVAKIRILLLILLVGSGIAGCADVVKNGGASVNEAGVLVRPRGQEPVNLEARVEAEGQKIVQETFSLAVRERTLTEAEAEACYEDLLILLEAQLPGENVSLQEVRENLKLPYEVEGLPFSIEWKSSDPSLMAFDGTIFTEDLDSPQQVTLTMSVFYGQQEWNQDWEVVIYPPLRTEKEQLVYELKKLAKEAEEAQKYEENVTLPQFIEGKEIFWSMPKDHTGGILLLVTFLTGILVYYMKDKDLGEELAKRRKEMKTEYPMIVSKYALFLEAGMTVRGAFIKICRDYYEKEPDKIHPLYQEMHYSCNELKAGVSESRVYENFGRRTGVQEYTRLCGLLGQNLKKGNTALAKRLKEESEEALRESMQWKKRQGEEAGTKLLLPMGMLLVMVLVMIMLPAFSGLGI